MNKTRIETCDYTWNPCTGCWGPGGTAEKPNRCPYCYAERVAKRFHGEPTDEYYGNKKPDPFFPKFWPGRLSQPAKVKKPSKIFVCSMADLFGDWVPTSWIVEVLLTVHDCPHHTFQFLTKNPKRLRDFNPWPSNCWVGCTVTNQADADERIPWLLQVDAPVRFVSQEPLIGATKMLWKWLSDPRPHPKSLELFSPMTTITGGVDWAIIGAMTGPGAVKPTLYWIKDLVDQYRAAGVPLFLKDNLLPFMKGGCQEFPA